MTYLKKNVGTINKNGIDDFAWGDFWWNDDNPYFIYLQFIPVVESSCQQLLAEGNNISRVVQTPMLMGPELACCPSTCLHLIHVESTAMLKDPDTDKHMLAHSLSKPILSACIKLHTTPAGHSCCALLATLHLKRTLPKFFRESVDFNTIT